MTEKSYAVTVTSGVTVITLGPRFASAFEATLAQLTELPDLAEYVELPTMMIDLRAVEYCGSAFVGFQRKLACTLPNRARGRFAVCNPNSFAKMVLTTTTSEVLFSIFDTIDDGIATLGL